MPFAMVADGIVQMAAELVRKGDARQLHALDALPLPVYVTDIAGVVTYFNPACVGFTGRQPVLGRDRWCETWKLNTDNGNEQPHEQRSIADQILSGHGKRGAIAVAERPDGSQVPFMPFPAPVVSDNGELIGVVNVLIDMTNLPAPPPTHNDGALPDLQKAQIDEALAKLTIAEIKKFMEEVDMELAGRVPRLVN